MSGELVLIESSDDDSAPRAVGRRARTLAERAVVTLAIGCGLAALVAWAVDNLVVGAPNLAAIPAGLAPAMACVVLAAGAYLEVVWLTGVGTHNASYLERMARAVAPGHFARDMSTAALVALAIFTPLALIWFFIQTLVGMGSADEAAAAWAQLAGASIMVPSILAARLFMRRTQAALETSIGPDGHYWWDGEFWHPMMKRRAAGPSS